MKVGIDVHALESRSSGVVTRTSSAKSSGGQFKIRTNHHFDQLSETNFGQSLVMKVGIDAHTPAEHCSRGLTKNHLTAARAQRITSPGERLLI
jgi:hypothetical protein